MKRSLNRSRLIFTLLLSLVLFSCRTVKETSRSETNIRKEVENKVEATINTVVDSSSVTKENTEHRTLDSTTTRVVDVYLSAPDSLGAQYPLRITFINTEELKATVEHALKVFQANNHKSESIKAKADQRDNQTAAVDTSNKESKKPPDASYLLVTVIVIGLMAAAYFLLPWKDILKRISKLFK